MQTICTSLPTDNHTNTSSLNSLQAGCSFRRPTNSIKAPKAHSIQKNSTSNLIIKLQIHREAEEKEPLLFYEYFNMQCNLTKFSPLIVMNIIIDVTYLISGI